MSFQVSAIFSSMVRKLNDSISASEFRRGLVVLMAGTAVAQVIPIAISPIITRLYTPHDFGYYGFFMSLVGLVSGWSCLRFDAAVVLAKDSKDARSLFLLSLLASLACCVAVSVAYEVVHNSGVWPEQFEKIGSLGHWIPLGIFVLSAGRSWSYYASREKAFADLSKIRVAQAVVSATTNISFGALKLGPVGLICGVLFANLLSSFWLGVKFGRGVFSDFVSTLRNIKSVARSFLEFSVKGTAVLFVSTAATNSLVILSLQFFGSSAGGVIVLIERIIGVFSQVIGNSIGEVLYRKVSDNSHNNWAVVSKTAGALFAVSLAIHVGLFVGVQYLFVPLFGQNWAEGKHVALPFLGVSLMAFAYMPLSVLYQYYRFQSLELLWQVAWLFSNIFVFWFGYSNGWTLLETFYLFVIKQSALYAAGIVVVLTAAYKREKNRTHLQSSP